MGTDGESLHPGSELAGSSEQPGPTLKPLASVPVAGDPDSANRLWVLAPPPGRGPGVLVDGGDGAGTVTVRTVAVAGVLTTWLVVGFDEARPLVFDKSSWLLWGEHAACTAAETVVDAAVRNLGGAPLNGSTSSTYSSAPLGCAGAPLAQHAAAIAT